MLRATLAVLASVCFCFVIRPLYASGLSGQEVFLIYFYAICSRVENGRELAAKPKTGRPSLFSEKVAEEIISACRSGFTMEKAGELVGLEPKTIQAWVTKRPAFGARVKKARKEHEISLLRSIEVAGEKSWQAKAWLAERVYNYAQPSSRLEVAGAIAHAHGATPNLAQLLANMNTAKSVDGIGNGALQLADREGGKLSESIGQKRKVRRLSQRPTRPPHGDGQTPTAVRHAYTPPEKSAEKQKE